MLSLGVSSKLKSKDVKDESVLSTENGPACVNQILERAVK
jgi:hypothetical protein